MLTTWCPHCVKCLNATSPQGLCGECSSLLSEKDTLVKEVLMPDEGDLQEPPANIVTLATSQESISDLVGSDSTSEGEDIPPKLPKFQLKLEDLDLQKGYYMGLTTPGSPTAEKANVKWEFPKLNKEDMASAGAPGKEKAPWQLVTKLKTGKVKTTSANPCPQDRAAAKRKIDLLLCQMGCLLCLGGHLQKPCPHVKLNRLPAVENSNRLATLANLDKIE